MKSYLEHLILNWKVAIHSLNDVAEHFIHGIFPFISWKHYHEENAEVMDKRTVENCSIAKEFDYNGRIEEIEGVMRCNGMCGDGDEPYYKCTRCKLYYFYDEDDQL